MEMRIKLIVYEIFEPSSFGWMQIYIFIVARVAQAAHFYLGTCQRLQTISIKILQTQTNPLDGDHPTSCICSIISSFSTRDNDKS